MSLANDVSARPSHPRAVAIGLVLGAVLSAVALVALRLHFQPPTVPPYALFALAPDGGGDVERVLHGHLFAMEVRPTAPVAGAIAARAFLVRGGQVRAWDPPFTVDVGGRVRIGGEVDRLFAGVPEGPWEVAVAVGRPELLPTAPNDVLRRRGSASREAQDAGIPAGWYLVLKPIFLET